MIRLFKETLHANGPPLISSRDKIEEHLWGKKITTLDYPLGIEIKSDGQIEEKKKVTIESIEQGFRQLVERERLIHEEDEFKKSIAKKYNAYALLQLKEQEKEEKTDREQEDDEKEEPIEEEEEETKEEEEEEEVEEESEKEEEVITSESDHDDDDAAEGDDDDEIFEDQDIDLEFEKDDDFLI